MTWVFTGLTAVFGVAMGVAWWEHLRRSAEDRRARLLSLESRLEFERDAEARAARQDAVQPAPALSPQSDLGTRKSTLHQALTRMAERREKAIDPDTWIDTEPLINLGPAGQFDLTLPLELHPPRLRH